MTERFRDLRFIQFTNRMKDIYYWSLKFEKDYMDKFPVLMAESAGQLFKAREFFYDHFDWRF